MRYDVITISREYGAGGSVLASRLGERLAWRVLDSEIPALVAGRLGVPLESLEAWDEHAPGFLESLGDAFTLGSPDVLLDPDYAPRPRARDVARETAVVLREAAATPGIIIVGHGAQVLLRDDPRALHLRLVAPMADRAHRIMVRRACTHEQAVAIARYVDRDRLHYVQQFHGRDLRDPTLYALQLNTGRVAMDDAVALVVRLAEDAAA